MTIQKVAREPRFLRPQLAFESARMSFEAFLRAANPDGRQFVLLPAFIGWSAREGSGVFDPIRNLGLSYKFYPMTDDLRIDLDRLADLLRRHPVRVLVLIHYFGYVDPAYEQAVELARQAGALILEDEAHAMLSDLVGGVCGRAGDAAIFSLHKMLPVQSGGRLLFNSPDHPLLAAVAEAAALDCAVGLDYDLAEIARLRVENARRVERLLPALEGVIDPLWPGLPEGTVPQTYPVLVRSGSRDELYFRLNHAGYGVVSLYHTMVAELDAATFPAAHRLARRILNLPVHQDACPEQIETMVAELGRQARLVAEAVSA